MENKLDITGHQSPKPRTDQDRIMFQNQSHLIQNYFNNCGVCPDLYDLGLATDLMVEYVKYGSKSEPLKERFNKFQDYINKKYKGGK